MRNVVFLSLLAATAMAPAHAAVLLPAAQNVTFSAFDPSTKGTLVDSAVTGGQALTFAATFRSAVYRNSLGTLDFYYQVLRTGKGSAKAKNDQEIKRFTISAFDGFKVEAFVSSADPDGAGQFKIVNNPTPAGGSTTLVSRDVAGEVIDVNFWGTGKNGLTGTENSATYIFRTNATRYGEGTFGVINGSTLSGTTFAPTVPEPATWAMMIGGFALAGSALRRRPAGRNVLA
jgi:hypothetical protein